MHRLLLIAALLFSYPASAQEHQIETAAGEIRYFKNTASSECNFVRGKDVILKFGCKWSYPPLVLGDFKNVGSLKEVVVIQESPMGNACNGGPLHFIAVTADGKYKATGPLDFCGGKDPEISRSGSALVITFPGGPPNRGTGIIPTERWLYSEGEIKRAR